MKKLKEVLARHNMSQKDLAVALKCSETLVNFYVKGRYTPTEEKRNAIFKVLGLDEDEATS